MPGRENILSRLKRKLDKERFEHSLRVEKTAVALAVKHHVPVEKAALAALLHDYARQFSRKGMLKEARRLKIKIDPISRTEPKLLHAEISARLVKKDFGIKDKAILNAIRKHTIGSAGMSRLEKIIYLADHVEEGRSFHGVKKARSLALLDLDRAIVETTTQMLKYLVSRDLPVHPGTVKTRNYYLLIK